MRQPNADVNSSWTGSLGYYFQTSMNAFGQLIFWISIAGALSKKTEGLEEITVSDGARTVTVTGLGKTVGGLTEISIGTHETRTVRGCKITPDHFVMFEELRKELASRDEAELFQMAQNDFANPGLVMDEKGENGKTSALLFGGRSTPFSFEVDSYQLEKNGDKKRLVAGSVRKAREEHDVPCLNAETGGPNDYQHIRVICDNVRTETGRKTNCHFWLGGMKSRTRLLFEERPNFDQSSELKKEESEEITHSSSIKLEL